MAEDNIDNGDGWPELDAIENIIEKTRYYATDNQCSVKILFQIEFVCISEDEVKERYITTAFPIDGTPNSEAINADLKAIIVNEMKTAFPDVKSTTINMDSLTKQDITETVTSIDDIEQLERQPIDGIISIQMLEDNNAE